MEDRSSWGTSSGSHARSGGPKNKRKTNPQRSSECWTWGGRTWGGLALWKRGCNLGAKLYDQRPKLKTQSCAAALPSKLQKERMETRPCENPNSCRQQLTRFGSTSSKLLKKTEPFQERRSSNNTSSWFVYPGHVQQTANTVSEVLCTRSTVQKVTNTIASVSAAEICCDDKSQQSRHRKNI